MRIARGTNDRTSEMSEWFVILYVLFFCLYIIYKTINLIPGNFFHTSERFSNVWQLHRYWLPVVVIVLVFFIYIYIFLFSAINSYHRPEVKQRERLYICGRTHFGRDPILFIICILYIYTEWSKLFVTIVATF